MASGQVASLCLSEAVFALLTIKKMAPADSRRPADGFVEMISLVSLSVGLPESVGGNNLGQDSIHLNCCRRFTA